MNVLYVMPEYQVREFGNAKDLLIQTRAAMKKGEVKAAKEDVIQNAKVFDFDPEDSGDNKDFYSFNDGVAQIHVKGMLVQQVDICAAFYGETVTTYRYIREAVLRADNDPFVDQIAFLIDSSGGNLSGLEITSQRFFSSSKKTTAVVFNKADSAAYWLAASCDEVVLASKTSEVGSIGVVIEVYNRTVEEEASGVKREFITNTASSEKIADLRTDEGKNLVVDQMNTVYNIFKETVLIKRSEVLTDEKIDSLKGRVLVGREAIDFGLADKMLKSDEVLEYLVRGSIGLESAPLVNEDGNINKENFMDVKLTLNEVLAKYPEAKAEHEAQQAANAENQDKALKADRERFARILTLSGAKISEAVLLDAKNGMSVAESSEKELESKTRIDANTDTQDLGELNSSSQLPKKLTAEEEGETSYLARVDNAIDKLVGKNNQKGVK